MAHLTSPAPAARVARPRRLQVLVVAPHAVHGGQEEWLLQLLDATDRLDVRVLLLQDGALRGLLEQRGVAVDVLPVGTRPASLALPVARLTARLRREPPDVVLANGVKAQFVAAPAARAAGVPLVFVRHDHAFEGAVRRLSRWADRVVGTTEEVLRAVDRPDAVVVPPPLPPPAEPAERARAALADLGVPAGEGLVLGMLTRLVAYKGVDHAVRALALPAAAGWRLVVLGGDDPSEPGEADRLRALAAELGVAARVHLVGHVPGGARLVSGLDALAVLTRSAGPRGPSGEGFGMTALEAMAAGVPVVTVPDGAVARRLAGRAGLVVPRGDEGALAQALGALGDPAERARLGAAGRELVRDHPDATRCAAVLCGVLAEAARRPGAGLVADAPVSVVVPVHDEGADVDAVVAAVGAQLRGHDELVVVDDASRDDTRARLERLARDRPHLVVAGHDSNAGPGPARNTGIAAARHDLLVCTDAGVDLPEGWLEAMRAALCDTPAPDLVSGAFRVSRRGTWERVSAAALFPDVGDVRQPRPAARLHARVFGRTFTADRPVGRSVAFRRAAWERVGGFPASRTAEDTTFGSAVAAGGRCVLQTDAPVVWRQHRGPRRAARMFAAYGHGDGLQGDPVGLLRNGVRAGAALAAPVLLLAGGRTARAAVTLGAAAYVSLPLARLRSDPAPLRTGALVPFALALKDLSKAYGCATGLLEARRQRRPGGP